MLLRLFLVLVLVKLFKGVVVGIGGVLEHRRLVVLLVHLESLVVLCPLLFFIIPLDFLLFFLLFLVLGIPLQSFERQHLLLLFRAKEILLIELDILLVVLLFLFL